MGNICASPSELISKLKGQGASQSRASVDSLDIVCQKHNNRVQYDETQAGNFTTEQRVLLEQCHDEKIRKQMETKFKMENKLKHKIEVISHLDGFDYDGLTSSKTIASSKLLLARTEINKSKTVFEKEIETEVPEGSPNEPRNVLSKETGYYRKE